MSVEYDVECAQCGFRSIYYELLSQICGNKLYDFDCPHCGGEYLVV